MNTPLVSIVLPFYNAGMYLEETLLSIKQQEYKNFEVLGLNDGSTDNSLEIFKALETSDSRFKLYSLDPNIYSPETNNLVEALNLGLHHSKGKYIARMDADDLMHPKRLAIQTQFMEGNQDVDIAGTYFRCFGKSNKLIKHPTRDGDIKTLLLTGCALGHPTVILKAETFRSLNIRYSSEFRHAEDFELWSRAAFKYNLTFANIAKELLLYRTHDKQISESQQIAQKEKTREISNRNFKALGVTNVVDIHYSRLLLETNVILSLKALYITFALKKNLKASKWRASIRSLILGTLIHTSKQAFVIFFKKSLLIQRLCPKGLRERTKNYIFFSTKYRYFKND